MMRRFLLAFAAAVLLLSLDPIASTSGQVEAPFVIPLIVVGVAYALGYATLTAVIITIATTALSFIAQALMQKPSAGPSPTYDTGLVKIDQQQSVRQSAAPHRVIYGRARVGGIFALEETTDRNQNLWFCLMFAAHQCEAVEEIWLDDEKLVFADSDFGNVTEGKFKDVAYFNAPNLGSDFQLADSYLRANIPTIWLETDRLRGIANICGRLRWDNSSGDGTVGGKIWAGGMPNITVVVRGYSKIFDPRTDTFDFSRNSALVVADYLRNEQWGRKASYDERIDDALLIAAANICDEDVERSDGTTEKRYETDGSFTVDSPPDTILGRLLATMHGEAVFDGNRWGIYAGAYQAPTVTLTDDDMRGPSKVSTLTSGRDSFNGVKGTYTGPDVLWTEADFPAIQSAAMLERDGGREQWKDIELPFCISPSRAQRIAKIDLLLTQQEIVEQFFGKLSCYTVKTGNIIYRDSERFGWTQKPFKVARAQVGASGDPPVIGFDLLLQEVASDAWDFGADEDQSVDPAPNTNFPDIFPQPAQAPLTAIETLYQASPAMPWQSRVSFAWGAADDAFVTGGGGYLLRYRKLGDTNWTAVPQTRFAFHDADPIEAGTYEAQVRSISWAGIASPSSLTLDFEVYGLAAPPSPPGDLNVVPMAGGTVAHATYNQATDVDVLRGGFIYFRHSVLTTGATWAQSVSISRPLPGDSTEALLPLKSGTYMAKSLDVGGNWSSTFAGFVQSQDAAWDFVLLASLDEGPGFSGAKTNCVVGGDDILRIDDLGTPAATYEFSAGIDLGFAANVRVTSIIDSFSENIDDDIDGRSASVDDWPDWDGSPAGVETDVFTEMRKTTDDPAGSPVWSAWQRFHAVEARARGLEFRAKLTSNDAAFTPGVIALGVVVEEAGVPS